MRHPTSISRRWRRPRPRADAGEFYASRLSIRRRARLWFAQAFDIVDRDARCADIYNGIPLPSLPTPFERWNHRSFTCPVQRIYAGGGAIEGYRRCLNQMVTARFRHCWSWSPRHRRGTFSTTWRSRLLTARRSQHGRVLAEQGLSAPDSLLDLRTGYWNVFFCEPCLTPRRDPDVRIPWSEAAGLEKGRVVAGEAIRTAASLRVVRQAVASLEQLLHKAQHDFRLAQGPDEAITARLREDLEFARGKLAALDPNATRPATAPPQPPAPANAATATAPPRPPTPAAAATATAPPRPANATKPRVAVIVRGLHEPQPGCTTREARGCSTWRASLPAQAKLLFAPLANLGCVVDVCVEIKISRRVRAESARRPPRHRRDAYSMAWRCRFLTTRRSQNGRVIAEK